MRDDARLASSGSVNRSQVKQEDVGEQAGGFRQLKVEDALAYLEQVKSQFSGRPNVYNHFLDIMKEFKAQTIDTAEVIRRVSSLFQGHRKLILGFNTFLPPGFKIELRDDPTRGCVTGFSTPGGVFIALNGEEVISSQAPAMSLQGDVMPAQSQTPMSVDGTHHAQAPHNGQTQHHQMPQAQPREMHRAAQIPRPAESVYDRAAYMKPLIEAEEKVSMGLASSHGQHLSMSHGGADVRMKAAGVAQASNDTAAAALAGGFGSPATAAAVSGKPIEFDQAVTYVNKIKSRFSHNEAVYRTFLGILQTYQKEQKSIKEVHKQVSHLFKDHDDLLGEFSHFLPEQSPQTQRLGAAGQRIVSEGLSSRGKGQSVHVKQQPVLEGAISEQPSELQGSLWKGKEKSGKGSSTAKGKSTKSIPGAVGGITKQGSTPRQKSSAQDKKNRRTVSSTKKIGGETKLGHSPATAVGGGTAAEGPTPELEFFDELRNLLGSEGQQNYSEFIKCLSLFSQEIICGDELMRLADGLLNNRKPLTEAFRAFLNQADPKATQTAVSILRKAKTTAEGNGPPGSKGHSAPPIANTSAVRERVRDLPPLVGIGAPGPAHSGSRSPKINPLYKGKPLSEIGREFGTGLAETNSYVTLPSDLGPIQCTGMSAGDRSVLNHLCVSKGKTSGKSLLGDDRSRSLPDIKRSQSIAPRVAPTGKGHSHSGVSVSETPGSPRAVRDSSSETKLSIEDQRVELDLMISRALNTALKLERLIKGEIRNVSSLTAVDLKPLEMIYKDASCDIVDVLRSNPSVTAPVVLKSLMERLEDWKASRTTLEKIWKSKLFSSRSGTADSPRTWRRSELLDELFSEAKSANRSVEQSAEEETTDRKDVAAQLKTVNGELMCKDQNLSIVCDILWYAFEWEARDEDEADQGLEFLERVYRVLRKAQLESVAIFVDENLYVYIRLLCETSKRVQYVLDHNYDGLTADSLVQQVKGVLGGTVSLPVYDEHCKKLYGEDGNWVEPLSEFPLICKRFASAARRIPHRKVATELLRLAEESVQSAPDEEGSGGAADGERGPLADISNENKIPLPKHTRDTRARVLRTAMLLVAPTGGEIFEVKCSPEIEIAAKAGQSRMDLPVKVKVSIRYVSKDTAEQFERLDDYTETAGEKKVETVLTKYIRRAKRRKRVFEVTRSGSGAVADEMQRTDGLGVRVSGADGELIYVIGTEDFFMRNAFKRRKICDSARKHRDGMISAARQHV